MKPVICAYTKSRAGGGGGGEGRGGEGRGERCNSSILN